jgi:hypothetical protein
MQIKIEIDVKPEELRRFLGLPDVAGLQEDVLHFLREKLGAASESFDPASFVKDNLQTIRNSGTWKKFVAAAKARTPGMTPDEPAAATAKKRTRTRPAAAGQRPRRAAAKRRPAPVKPTPPSQGGEEQN